MRVGGHRGGQRHVRAPPEAQVRARRGARAHERGGREGVHPLRGLAP